MLSIILNIISFAIIAWWLSILLKITASKVRYLIIPAIAVFIFSMVLHIFGYYMSQENEGLFTVVTKSMICSFSLFVGSGGYWSNPDYESLIYNYLMNLNLAMAVCVSIVFLISAFIARLECMKRAWKITGNDDLHIIFGITSRSITLASDIDHMCKKEGQNFKIIFVDTPEANQIDDVPSLTFFEILSSFLSISPKAHKIIDYPDNWLVSVPENTKIGNLESTKIVNLYSAVAKTINNKKKVSFYVLTDSFEQNAQITHTLAEEIRDIVNSNEMSKNKPEEDSRGTSSRKERLFDIITNKLNLLDYKTLTRSIRIDFNPEEKQTIYSMIERVGPYKEMDFMIPEVDIICLDPAYLSVQQLKRESDDYHHEDQDKGQPINFMDIAEDDDGNRLGYVKGSFTSMIVGFGETGQNVLPFLYEYSAVPDAKGNRIPFKCYIIDDKNDNLKGNFMVNRPSVPFGSSIVFHDLKTDSTDFWRFIEEHIDDLNYIVLAIGNNSLQLKLAEDIAKYAYRNRKDNFKNFVIFTRLYGEDDKLIRHAIKNFNYRYNSSNNTRVLRWFGDQKDIYSYNVITELKERKAAQDIMIIESQGKDSPETWEERHFVWKKFKNDLKSDYSNKPEIKEQYWEEYSRVRLNENQDVSTAFFKDTIRTLAGWKKYKMHPSSNLELLLAKSLHLRKIAALEMAGYRYGKDYSIIAKTSNEIVPWENLDEGHKDMRSCILLKK